MSHAAGSAVALGHAELGSDCILAGGAFGRDVGPRQAMVWRMPGCDSQNSLSWIDSHSSAPIRTAAGDPFLVMVTWSCVMATESTYSLSLSLTFEIGSVCMAPEVGPNQPGQGRN